MKITRSRLNQILKEEMQAFRMEEMQKPTTWENVTDHWEMVPSDWDRSDKLKIAKEILGMIKDPGPMQDMFSEHYKIVNTDPPDEIIKKLDEYCNEKQQQIDAYNKKLKSDDDARMARYKALSADTESALDAQARLEEDAPPDMFGDPDEEGGMARSELLKIAKYGAELRDMLQDADQLPAWVQSKITKAAQMMGDVKHFIEGEMQNMQVDKPQEMAMDEQSDFDVSLEEVESVVAEEINSVLQQVLQEKKNKES